MRDQVAGKQAQAPFDVGDVLELRPLDAAMVKGHQDADQD